jgi:hypothetical protein
MSPNPSKARFTRNRSRRGVRQPYPRIAGAEIAESVTRAAESVGSVENAANVGSEAAQGARTSSAAAGMTATTTMSK